MEDTIYLNCDGVYNKILQYYIRKYSKKDMEIDLNYFEVKSLINKKLFDDKTGHIDLKLLLKQIKRKNHKLLNSSVINMPFKCPILVSIPFIECDDICNIKLTEDNIKTILGHFYKDSDIEFEYYSLQEIIEKNIDISRPIKQVVINKKLQANKVLIKNISN